MVACDIAHYVIRARTNQLYRHPSSGLRVITHDL